MTHPEHGPTKFWCAKHNPDNTTPEILRTPDDRTRSQVEQILAKEMPNHELVEPETRGFTEPEHGSQKRFEKRAKRVPWVRHRVWWAVHNALAHPLIAVFPKKWAFDFHDWTSERMHDSD